MQLTDSHCHLDFDCFQADRDAVLDRARVAGVQRFLLPATTRASWSPLLTLCRSDARLHPCLGLHPLFLVQHQPAHLQQLEALLAVHNDVIAVGEIGLDFYQADSITQQQQWQYLIDQLALARNLKLPVILHLRGAMEPLLQYVKRHPLPAGGVVHAFSGSLQQARQWVDLNFSLGIGGALTYPRAQRLRSIAATLPASAFLLETDSPDMPLQGYQGQRNEPARLAQVLACWADLRQEDPASLALQLEQNLMTRFPRLMQRVA